MDQRIYSNILRPHEEPGTILLEAQTPCASFPAYYWWKNYVHAPQSFLVVTYHFVLCPSGTRWTNDRSTVSGSNFLYSGFFPRCRKLHLFLQLHDRGRKKGTMGT